MSDGKQLEALVAFVERALTPHGLTVVTNQRVFDEGVQVAEFDVDVSGKFGSTEIRWLIECRDRPGEGPVPGSWVEQLVGRRGRFGFNKVTAVSTTSFATGAVEFAKAEDIELREVASLSPEAFIPWCSVRTVEHRHCIAEFKRATVLLDDGESPDKKLALEVLLANTLSDAPMLRSIKTDARGSFAAAFLSVVELAGNLFDDVAPNGIPKPVILRVQYTSDNDHFVIDTDAGAVRLRTIIYEGELHIKRTAAPLIGVAEYRQIDSENSISQVVSFEPQELLGKQISLELHRITDTGEVHLRLNNVGSKA